MQHSESAASSANSASFASLLAALSTPAKKPGGSWGEDAFAGDVATLSYEHALRAHARYKPDDPGDQPAKQTDRSLTQTPDRFALSAQEEETATPADAFTRAAEQSFTAQPPVFERQYPNHSRSLHTRATRDRLRASVTIRLSDDECEQLRQRAAEAGVTVSAYLRSCTFEAEALRSQVKETLMQLRAATQPMKSAVAPERTARRRSSWRQWLLHFWPGKARQVAGN